ncbi:Putative teichuronic acid biosynthesis glycosyltransferase TuaH [Plantibacter cousiniae]|nr:Putative teichuronic acid biosynthesis glycosyltransferase TuaH [Plantibacter cousiniae]
MSGQPPLTIMFVSHTDAFGTFRVGSHHLARELSKLGHRVLHLSTPVSLAHRLLGRGEASRDHASRQGAITDADGVTHLVPRTIFPAGSSRLPYERIVSHVFGEPKVDVVLIDQPTLWSLQLRRVATTLVYRPTDLYETGTKARFQRSILSEADAAVATSSEVLARLPLSPGTPSMALPNGVELARFAEASSTDARPQRAIYVGALDDRFDWGAVRAMADSASDWTFDIYGPGPAPTAPLPGNVTLRGVVSYDDLPAVLGRARIGLLPLSDAPVNQGRSPMKLYEYLASGLAVVTRATPVLQAAPASGVFTYTTTRDAARAFAAAQTVANPNVQGQAAASAQDWASKASALLSFVCEARV